MKKFRLKWLSKIEAIGWDLDGTLYPADSIPQELMRDKQYMAVADKMGWDIKKAESEFNRKLEKLGSHTKTLNTFGIDGISFFVAVWDVLPLREYIKRDERVIKLFESLSHLRHFIISNSNRVDQIERKLALVGVDPKIFEEIVSTVEVGAVKPDAKPFRVALKRLKLKPKQVLFVGDREGTDIRGARGVGMRTCMVWGKSNLADIHLATVYDVGELFGE